MALLFAISMIGSAASVTCYPSYRVALLSQLRGEYPRLFEMVDPPNTVPESNETNNTRCFPTLFVVR
jgi:hypothetical protein